MDKPDLAKRIYKLLNGDWSYKQCLRYLNSIMPDELESLAEDVEKELLIPDPERSLESQDQGRVSAIDIEDLLKD